VRLTEREFEQLCGQKTKNAATMRRGPKEAEIQNSIRECLRWNGWFVVRHQQTLGSHRGLSDLTAIKDGVTVYIEVKTPHGVLSADQEAFRAEIEAHGGTYIVARSVEDVQALCGDFAKCLCQKK
jgi:hypothetical protein